MSEGVVFQEALRRLRRLELPEQAERDVLKALEAGRPGPLGLLYEAGHAAGLPREVLLQRAAGLFYSFCAGNLADDLIDGDCTWYEEPLRVGPNVQFLLQNLAFSTLAESGVPVPALAAGTRALALAAGPQSLEVRTKEWTAPLYQQVAEGLAGQQWAAYLGLLFAGTSLEDTAAQLGHRVGVAAYVSEDVRTGDARFYTLTDAEQRDVLRWAETLVAPLEANARGWVSAVLGPVLATLRAWPHAPADGAEVADYYAQKTESILRRYGPGPRVHFHTGLVDAAPPSGSEHGTLKRVMLEAQERLLRHAATRLLDGGHSTGALLDVGCGLGGGALYWAAEHGAHVTAITTARTHLPWVERFAAEAGVGEQVRAQLDDALAVPGEACFDTVVAVESSCYLPRREWLAHVARLLRPGGRALVLDCFLGRRELQVPFDRYWRTRIGTRAEYREAAGVSGLRVCTEELLSHEAARFWDVTLTLLERERADALGPRRTRWADSRREHRRLQQALRDGGLEYGLLVLERP